MQLRKVSAGFVCFGEVFSPRELIEKKCLEARQALEVRGMELVATAQEPAHEVLAHETRGTRHENPPGLAETR